ncbi:MAG: glycosyltransferase [Ethanoligenens sp.]
MTQSPLLTLCMIVKNEHTCLERCLQSVQGVVDQIVVVDTGSTDDSQEICRRYHAEVYPREWDDDFAAARNAGIEKAKGRWILWMDADEQLETTQKDVFLKELRDSDASLFSVRMVHFMGERPDLHQVFFSDSYRLFRNGRSIRFIGKIHEHLNLPSGISSKNFEKGLPIRLLHDGYLDTAVFQKQKTKRNLTLLEKERVKSDHSPWIDYHTAVEYFGMHAFEKAFACVNDAISGFLKKKRMPPSMLYHLKYSILLEHGVPAETLQGLEKALALYPDYVDLHFFKGILLMSEKQYTRAAQVFRHCLMLGDAIPHYLTYNGYGSFYAYYFFGKCCEQLGQIPLARDAYEQAIYLYPDDQQARSSLQAIQEKQKAE